MRLAFIADGRAEHVHRLLPFFVRAGDDVLLLSTFPCPDDLPGVAVRALPKLFRAGQAMVKRSSPLRTPASGGRAVRMLVRSGLYPAVWSLWHQAAVAEVPAQALAARRTLDAYRPDVVQAIRIQNEGYVAALAGRHPWVQLVWGQDFVHFAQRYPVHGALTRFAVSRADALLADCRRDIRLARVAGLPRQAPTDYFPGNGGVDLDLYRPGVEAGRRERLVVHPRGVAPYLRLDTLLRSVELLVRRPHLADVRFLLLVPAALVPMVEQMVADQALPPASVTVGSFLSQVALAALLQRAALIVSPALSDGTPNSMLEAMACGAFPVMGDIESIREWITPGVNGLLFDPNDPQALAACLEDALGNVELRQRAQEVNVGLVRERADRARSLPRLRELYLALAGGAHAP
ncbi:MAG: glycosyltransferase [Chloroflexi bacterium]|nr:glycosyltransferase [Chloroflexota bacterium]